MAKVTITINDNPEGSGGNVSISTEFDPPLSKDVEWSAALQLFKGIMEYIDDEVNQTDEDYEDGDEE